MIPPNALTSEIHAPALERPLTRDQIAGVIAYRGVLYAAAASLSLIAVIAVIMVSCWVMMP